MIMYFLCVDLQACVLILRSPALLYAARYVFFPKSFLIFTRPWQMYNKAHFCEKKKIAAALPMCFFFREGWEGKGQEKKKDYLRAKTQWEHDLYYYYELEIQQLL